MLFVPYDMMNHVSWKEVRSLKEIAAHYISFIVDEIPLYGSNNMQSLDRVR